MLYTGRLPSTFRTVLLSCITGGGVVPSTISSHCCSIPFTLNGNLHYSCTDDGFGVGCFYGDREWKLCQQPAGKFSK